MDFDFYDSVGTCDKSYDLLIKEIQRKQDEVYIARIKLLKKLIIDRLLKYRFCRAKNDAEEGDISYTTGYKWHNDTLSYHLEDNSNFEIGFKKFNNSVAYCDISFAYDIIEIFSPIGEYLYVEILYINSLISYNNLTLKYIYPDNFIDNISQIKNPTVISTYNYDYIVIWLSLLNIFPFELSQKIISFIIFERTFTLIK